ncbi:MAG: PP2C family protein-serine/threonine phosphatase [Planctomycetota bacterium]
MEAAVDQLVELAQHDSELEELLRILQRASQAKEPQDIQDTFAGVMQRLGGSEGYMSLSVRDLPAGKFRVTRVLNQNEHIYRPDPWRERDQLPIFEGGIIGRAIETPTPKVIHELDPSSENAIHPRLSEMKSMMAFPLFDQGEAKNWGLLFRSQPKWEIDYPNLRDFIARANMLGSNVNLLVTNKRVEELRKRLEDQLQQVATIQQSLLPSRTPCVPGLEIATSYLTSNEAGGDYYDFFDMGDGNFAILIADVSGHGAGAATIMAMLRAILHSYQERSKGPAAMLDHANRQLVANDIGANFVTAFMVSFSADREIVTYANAGHNPPVVMPTDSEIFTVDDARSLPLGIIDDAEYIEASKPTKNGASVALYTDGIVEATPPGTAEQFGMNKLMAAINATNGEAEAMIESIHQKLFAFTGRRDRDDDQTIVTIRHYR